MALLDIIRRPFERIGTNLENYMGGLLGENVEDMTPEERRRLRQRAIMAISEGMATMTPVSTTLREAADEEMARRQRMAQQRQAGRAAQDIQQASAAIAGRLGARGADVGEQTQLEEVRPMSGMNLEALIASPAGAAALQTNPQLAELIKQRTGQQVVGGLIYDRATGRYIPPPVPTQAPAARAAATTRAEPTAMAGAEGPRFRRMTPQEVADAGYPEGTVVQMDTETGAEKILSSVPTTQRAVEAGRATAVRRVDSIADRLTNQMDKVSTGGFIGLTGALSRVFDSQDAKLFESYRQQLSAALRTALRIPGEGALSDRDLQLYGLQLPELGQSKANNLAILESLKEQVRLAANMQPIGEEPAAQEDVEFIFQGGRLVPARTR
jgi:hypothetical protein